MLALIICIAANAINANAENPDNPVASESDSHRIHYMGNIEGGNLFPWQDFMNNSSGLATLNTSHGVVIKPWLYTGLGVGIWFVYAHEGIGLALPAFADVRFTYPNRKWRPFADLKIGTFVGGDALNHFLINPSVGIKYAIKDTFGIYLSAGTMGYYHTRYSDIRSFSQGLSFNLGFDF